jgi:hypothetical protein
MTSFFDQILLYYWLVPGMSFIQMHELGCDLLLFLSLAVVCFWRQVARVQLFAACFLFFMIFWSMFSIFMNMFDFL